ncbi:MAG: hypothetical protein HOC63_16985 [Rhodospirillales bacterium]|jgi:acetoin utilization deacetylase AcuC-like enzyme|nr:hypothetical protein [Rhodospirillales bacterium]MBT4038867.1 hypothetical protein [Rhodospirillales bacterium]MBT4628372.1 hypothetical protein [Rhodospirillales bacterium]MBT5351166.1 hypothetical protein [Rhodospirillales bacterium]MBT5519773.1 hypothetical protein [Rhodospirillales bacterium]
MTDQLSVFFDPKIFEHNTGEGFFDSIPSEYLPVVELAPENADRTRNMLGVLKDGPIKSSLTWHQAPPADREATALFHEDGYLDSLDAIGPTEIVRYSNTTVFGPGSMGAINAAAGQTIGAADHVWSGEVKLAYALVRPPGHHAQPTKADGYCFINNIGVAIEHLRQKGLKKAAVIDWDVHHGNGTQEGFYDDPDVLTISLHMPHGAWGESHHQTGAADEVGVGAGVGSNINIPLPYGSGDQAYARAFDEIIAPAIEAHAPEIIFVAAGQDANQFDPNGRQLLTMAGFHQLGLKARGLADKVSDGRLVLVQEGGYAMSYAAYCLHATLEGVLQIDPSLSDPIAYVPEDLRGLTQALEEIKAERASAIAQKSGA